MPHCLKPCARLWRGGKYFQREKPVALIIYTNPTNSMNISVVHDNPSKKGAFDVGPTLKMHLGKCFVFVGITMRN